MTDQITYLPASALRESPFNPRKSFAADALADLAESIKSQGILQPIVVRPLPDGQADIEHRYEIVFGHRRFRAASSLPEYQDDTLRLPCILRDMDDMDASIAQVAENLQRADVTAIEEADSFRHLHWSHNLSADAIAERVGKSRSYVYARLKLAAAGADVRNAVLEQGLLPEVALEVARLRGDKLQRMGLQAIKAGDNEWQSQRRAKVVIRDMLTEHQLDAAPFDQADATLVHCAPACSGCPKRAGNDPDLVAQGIAADVCTDPVCFGDKLRAHSGRVVIQLKAEGIEVIEAAAAAKLFQGQGGRYSTPFGYTSTSYSHAIGGYDDDGDYVHRSVDEAVQALIDAGEQVPEFKRVAIVHPETGAHGTYVRAADAELLRKALRDLSHRRRTESARANTGAPTPSTAARAQAGARVDDNQDVMADWTPAERAATSHEAIRRAREAALRNMLGQPRTTDDLRLMVLREFDLGGELGREHIMIMMGLTVELSAAQAADEDLHERTWWERRLATMSADQLGQIVVGLAIGELFDPVHVWLGPNSAESQAKAAVQVALAQRYGVDLAAIAAQLEEQTDGSAAGGSDAKTEPANGDLFGGTASDQTDNAGDAGGPRAPALLIPAAAWPFPKRAA